jgi:hypothetical protein
MEMWQRLASLKISCYFGIPVKVIRNKGRLVVVVPLGDRRTVIICLMLMTLKPRFTGPSDMSSAGVLWGFSDEAALGYFWLCPGILFLATTAYLSRIFGKPALGRPPPSTVLANLTMYHHVVQCNPTWGHELYVFTLQQRERFSAMVNMSCNSRNVSMIYRTSTNFMYSHKST